MAQPGPRPQPSSIRLLNGNPGKRAINKSEPRPDLITPENPLPCPAYLDAGGREEWEHIVPILMRMRVLTDADETMVVAWCMHKSYLVSAMRDLAKMGTIVREGDKEKTLTDGSVVKYKGHIRQNPLLTVIQKETAIIKGLAAEFGLTSSSRVRLIAPNDGGGNPWAEFD